MVLFKSLTQKLFLLLIGIFFLSFLFVNYSMPVKATESLDIFFSEYIEGSGNNKAIEIYNPTDSIIDLTGYTIEKYPNGSTVPSEILPLTGTLSLGGVYVICNPLSNKAIIDVCSYQSAFLDFDGNDTLVLNNQMNSPIDAIGQIGFDPGATGWVNGNISTVDQTLTKKCWIYPGDYNPNDSFNPSLGWDNYPIDDFTHLGSHNLCSEPVCGNGIVESGEQCDDGNTVNGDSCSSTCQIELIPGSISGFVYYDWNGNNVFDGLPEGEIKISNVKVFIDQNNNRILDDGEIFDLTQGLPLRGYGSYSFDGILPGTYLVCDVLRPRWYSTLPDLSNCQTVALGNGENKTEINFGNRFLPVRRSTR